MILNFKFVTTLVKCFTNKIVCTYVRNCHKYYRFGSIFEAQFLFVQYKELGIACDPVQRTQMCGFKLCGGGYRNLLAGDLEKDVLVQVVTNPQVIQESVCENKGTQ